MTPDAQALLAAYDAELRGVAEMSSAVTWDHAGPLWRAVHATRGLVSYESLEGYDLVRLVRATVDHFASLPQIETFEWKTRGHDDLPGLDDVLLSAGFVAEEVETVMVGEASLLAVDVDLPAGVRVRRIDDAPDAQAAMAAASAVQQQVFGGGPDLATLVRRGGGDTEVWAAETEDGPVCVGRLDVVPGTRFAGLWGGATLPRWRGQGIYRSLTAARARSAMARGATLVHSDCTVMSRPVLERSGLVPVTTTTPYVWTRP